MVCTNCGTDNKNESKFCSKCGMKLHISDSNIDNDSKINMQSEVNTESDKLSSTNPDTIHKVSGLYNQVKNMGLLTNNKLLRNASLIIAMIIAVFAVITVIGNTSKPTINLNKYVDIKYDGYDGYGSAKVSIDWASIQNKYHSKLKYTKAGELVYGEYYEPVTALEEYIDAPKLEKSKDLKNGDEVEYKWNIDEKQLEQHIKCKVKYKDSSFKVSGLEEAEKFDIFENLKVEFKGVGPAGVLIYQYEGEGIGNSYFQASKTTNLSNGDKVTIKLTKDDPKYFIKEYKKLPLTMEKEYTVEGLGKYISKVSDLSQDSLDYIKDIAKAKAYDSNSDFALDDSLDSITYIGSYVAFVDNDDAHVHNYLGLVYKIETRLKSNNNSESTNMTHYYDISFKNIYVNDDGNIEKDNNEYMFGDRNISYPGRFEKKIQYGTNSWDYNRYYFTGYTSLEDMRRYRINEFGDKYIFDWVIEGFDTNNETVVADNINTEDYLCPYSSERIITRDEIVSYINTDYSAYNFPGNRTIIRMIINEIYARHGYQFKENDLTDYFNNKEWYRGIANKNSDDYAVYNTMSAIEKDNIQLLREYQ